MTITGVRPPLQDISIRAKFLAHHQHGLFEDMLFMSPSVCSQGALALRQVAARVAVRNTVGRLFHITQVCVS